MPLNIRYQVPADNPELRQAVFDGTVFLLPANDVSRSLVDNVDRRIRHAFSEASDPRKVHEVLPGAEIFARLQNLRRNLADEIYSQGRIAGLVETLGFAKGDIASDPLRLRAATHAGHLNPAAASAYTVHRDTWYANSQSQLNWWIPIYDVGQDETFHFYPALFNRAVANTSGAFDYDHWKSTVGFQGGKSAGLYPTVTKPLPDTESCGFSCRAGDILIFSAAHLHQTNANMSGKTRFSLDFRTVNGADARAGRGAPNADNSARGRAEKDYISLQAAP